MTKSRQQALPKRRWAMIGPGLILALILALQIVISDRRADSKQPPIVESQVIGAASAGDVQLIPEVSFVLLRRDELDLNEQQLASMQRLQREWKNKSGMLQDQLDRAAEDFRKFMKTAGGKVTVQELQTQSEEVSVLSRQLSGLRRIYWQKTLLVLNDGQRKTIERELASQHTGSHKDR